MPGHLFKLMYDATSHKAWAHWRENADSARAGKQISYAKLVQRTGVQFLPKANIRE